MTMMRSLKSVRITQINLTIVGNKDFKMDSISLLFSYYDKGMNNPLSTTYVTTLCDRFISIVSFLSVKVVNSYCEGS